MKKIITNITIISFILTLLLGAIYFRTENGIILSLAITMGTTLYHFAMRLVVGFFYDKLMNNKADLGKWWYQPKGFEKRIYSRLNVKNWKSIMPSYEPELFNPQKHTWNEIAQAMCQAELVHETIILLSFVPILFAKLFDALSVFVITSALAAAFDVIFVIMQRYNRPRVIKLAMREKAHKGGIHNAE
ncbi:MAG: hypothetical protein IJO47_01800 [Clostridia bacterium]|nr:hypothetical protein [Clostridia bacterium]